MCRQARISSRCHRLRLETMVRDQRGSELVEAAVVIGLVLTLLVGLVSMGRAFSVSQAMTRGAREGARAVVLTSCATCGNAPYTATQVRTLYVDPALAAAHLDVAQVQNYATTYVLLDAAASTPYQCGVRVSFDYPFRFVIPFTPLHLTTITISTQVQMRLENQPTTCTPGSAVP